MKNAVSLGTADLLEKYLVVAMTSEDPIQIDAYSTQDIPLGLLRDVEKYVSGWKSLGFERRSMASCFHNPLVREAFYMRFPFLDQEEVERLREEWDSVLAFNRKSIELIL